MNQYVIAVCGEFLFLWKPKTLSDTGSFSKSVILWSTVTYNLRTSDHKRTTNCASKQKPVNSV